jgi:DNA repair protein RecO (recombination protein O)
VNSRFLKTTAIVLHARQFGEGHKLVNLYTESVGRMEASAFGARKTKSRFGSRLEPFTIGTFLLYHKNEQSPFAIRDVDVSHQNEAIRDDLNRFLVGHALIETVVRYVERAHRDSELFSVLSQALQVLNLLPPEKGLYLLSIYDVQFLSIMGYRPDMKHCASCTKSIGEEPLFSNGIAGFPLCGQCRTAQAEMLGDGVIRFMEWALQAAFNSAARVTMEPGTLSQLRVVIEHLYQATFGRLPESWGQLKNLYKA